MHVIFLFIRTQQCHLLSLWQSSTNNYSSILIQRSYFEGSAGRAEPFNLMNDVLDDSLEYLMDDLIRPPLLSQPLASKAKVEIMHLLYHPLTEVQGELNVETDLEKF